MEAKDVIKEAIREAREKKPGIILPAEDIYNAIFKAGIREVVESLPKGLFVADTPPEEGKPYSFLGCYILRWGKDTKPSMGLSELGDNEKWQAKLKEWNISA